MTKYLILDTESVFDQYLREAYEDIDDKCETARIASRKLVALSLWPIEVDQHGRITTGAIATWSADSCGGEEALLRNVFMYMTELADHTLVTYGGLAVDCQILQLAAMTADLALPPQLREQTGPRWKSAKHQDLGLALKGSGKTWHHMTEVLIRLGVPVALLLGKADPDIRPDRIDWPRVRQHCEADVLLTALVLIAWLRLQGGESLNIAAGQLAIVEAFMRRRPGSMREPILRRLADDLHARIAGALDEAA